MAFQLSPGVLVVEKDFTGIIPAVATTPGAYVGAFEWGPAMEVRLISDEDRLTSTFGYPNIDTFVDFFTCTNFLAYGNFLQVVRVVGAAAKNAVTKGTATLIKNLTDYETNAIDGQLNLGQWIAKYPGVKGNSISVVAIDACSSAGVYNAATWYDTQLWADLALRPGTTQYVADRTGMDETQDTAGGVADEMHIMVVDVNGQWTGTKGAILEQHFNVSKASDAKRADGTSNYYKNVINGESRYIWWADKLDTGRSVASVTIGGSPVGYHLATTTVTFAAPGGDGITATGHVTIPSDPGAITVIVIDEPGTGYTSAPLVTVTDSDGAPGSGGTFTAVLSAAQPSNHAAEIGAATSTITSTNLYKLLRLGTTTGQNYTLTGGVSDEDGVVNADRELGWDVFINADTYDVSLIPTGGADATLGKYVIDNVAESRKDCVVFVSPLLADVKYNAGAEATDAVTTRNLYGSSSYAVMDSGWKYQYDKYNDVFRWVPLNGDLAGLCARTDLTNDPWWSPGGLNRGRIKNVVKLAFSPNKSERDLLYINGVNPVVTFPGDGTVLFGDKTMQAKPSAFDRINVRRLFIVLEKAIAKAAKYQLFEFNDEFTRAMFRNMVEPFLRDVQGRRGVTDFKVICDETNNTGEVIDRNEFVADIYIKPARSINFITLNFIATKTGVAFSEVGA